MISFLTYSSFILGSWAESFPGSEIPPNIHKYNQVDQYKITTAGDFYVFQVTFTTIIETEGQGGAIYANAETKLLIESSRFIICHSKDKGGAIYFSNANGICFLKKVCSTNSYSSASQNHFCYISTKSSEQCTLCMENSCVANLKSTTNYDNNVDLCGSDIIIMKYDNFSKNECTDDAALGCYPSINGSISYTSFENNTSTDYDVIYLKNRNDVNTCNVIGNIDKNVNRGIIFITGSLQILNSCLIENTNHMFIFDTSGNSKCTVINCTIDNTDKVGNGYIKVDSIPDKSFINKLDNNFCFSMNMSIYCPTLNMRQYKCQMDEKRGIFILAKF